MVENQNSVGSVQILQSDGRGCSGSTFNKTEEIMNDILFVRSNID